MDKKKVLWISPYAPYDSVAHAGGKNHNYYLKYMHKSGKFDITLLSLCLKEEEPRLDLDRYGIKNHIFVMDRTRAKRFQRRAVSAWSYVNPFDRYAGICLKYERRHILKMLREYAAEGNVPDLVILQWTFSAMFIPVIRKMFADCHIIAIEEDVTFLGYMRKWKNADSRYDQWFWKNRYRIMLKQELAMLRQSDLIVTNNQKDTRLLLKHGMENQKIFTSTSYFDDYSYVEHSVTGKDILFFGDMSRAENYKSAIWFIDQVMPLLTDREIRFIVIGGRPDASLLQKQGGRVQVLGYVEDVGAYFAHSMCLVAPLLLGAGIKIKILEALSSGIPVLTNNIGIEGIAARDGKEYFHCETAEDYAGTIGQMVNGKLCVSEISRNARAFMRQYNLDESLEALMRRLACLQGQKE